MRPVESHVYRLAMACCWAAFAWLFAFEVGPVVESAAAPIRARQTVEVVERTEQRLCWRWSSVKLRPAISDNIDLFIVAAGDRLVGAPFFRETGMPWRLSGTVGAGPQSIVMCALLPPHLGRDAPVRIEQVIQYRGWHDLWPVLVRVPDVMWTGSP